MKTLKVIFTRGLPGSGKSTWAIDFCEKNHDWVRVNRDALRNMAGPYWRPKREGLITKWEDEAVMLALEEGYNVILDATNMDLNRNIARINKYRQSAPDISVKVETKMFDTPLEECVKRDLQRPNSVGEAVIRKFYDKYLAPPKVNYAEDIKLPRCVIFDVDGTLAKMYNRSPYDWAKVGNDLPNWPVVHLAKMVHAQGTKIVIFTGRDGSALEETTKWLKRWDIPYDEIYIRPAGNGEKDSIIKKRMFEEAIRGRYYVEFIVDDRDQVVEMWRKELGITCLQADYGNF